ncbi:hypothetical protein EN738_33110 [Mesorhizobium sp. M4B.F.Ca.ET.017.02.2.1]|nr:hypothetical protein EN738_33110 [Mesorhizobium sp. M4B.F.Ca.ET.017.02.2.1]
MDLSIQTVAVLAFAAFAAGFVDSIAGGGGLITIPALLLAGFSPTAALGTNKLQGMFGSGSATIHYAANGHVELRRQLPSALLALIGSAVGALLATIVPGDFLRALLPLLLIAIALYFALKPNMNDVDRAERLSPFLFGLIVPPLVGFYDGLFGPGAGSFYMLAFVSLAGYGVLKATAQFLGARLGASLAIRIGARLIKPLLVVVCVALAVKLLADPANPLRQLIGV